MLSLFLKIKKEQDINIRDKVIVFFQYCISIFKNLIFLK